MKYKAILFRNGKLSLYDFTSMDKLLEDFGQTKEETCLSIARKIEHYADEPIGDNVQYYALIGRKPKDNKEKIIANSYGHKGIGELWSGDLLLVPYADKERTIFRDATYREMYMLYDCISDGTFIYTEALI